MEYKMTDKLQELLFKIIDTVGTFDSLTIKFNKELTPLIKTFKVHKNDVIQFCNISAFTQGDNIVLIQEGQIILILSWYDITTIKFN